MKQVRTPADVRRLGTILSVWAHPDDESFSCAGIMAAAVQNGQTVACLTATKGEAGSQDEAKWPTATLGEVRAKEMEAALKIIGITNHHWLGYADGSCAEIPMAEAVAKLKPLIEQFRPNTILTFGPDGITGHTDHQAVSGWVDLAVAELSFKPVIYHAVQADWVYEKYLKKAHELFNIYFNIDEPPIKRPEDCDLYFELSPELCELKCQALSAMPSQTAGLFSYFDRTALRDAFSVESFVLRDIG